MRDVHCIAGVPPERQKVMVAGGTLPDDDWGKTRTKIKQVSHTARYVSSGPLFEVLRPLACLTAP